MTVKEFIKLFEIQCVEYSGGHRDRYYGPQIIEYRKVYLPYKQRLGLKDIIDYLKDGTIRKNEDSYGDERGKPLFTKEDLDRVANSTILTLSFEDKDTGCWCDHRCVTLHVIENGKTKKKVDDLIDAINEANTKIENAQKSFQLNPTRETSMACFDAIDEAKNEFKKKTGKNLEDAKAVYYDDSHDKPVITKMIEEIVWNFAERIRQNNRDNNL